MDARIWHCAGALLSHKAWHTSMLMCAAYALESITPCDHDSFCANSVFWIGLGTHCWIHEILGCIFAHGCVHTHASGEQFAHIGLHAHGHPSTLSPSGCSTNQCMGQRNVCTLVLACLSASGVGRQCIEGMRPNTCQ